ncbi:restriction endonuclease [Kineococcus sp. NBC_00420]|uniref:restriction endonuclease n=1 Tax=Kineococcus sp. NBC_00420 TaxID=2903564 RepID=UPI002E242599
MARKRTSRKQPTNIGDDAVKIVLAAVLIFGGVLRSWLEIWWPLLALAGAVTVVLFIWRVLVLRRRTRDRAARQARLDQQVATTDGLSGGDFEHLVARLLRRDGWRQVTVSGGSGDLGADITARHPKDGSLLVVQCKRYTDRAIGSPDLQRFLGPHLDDFDASRRRR